MQSVEVVPGLWVAVEEDADAHDTQPELWPSFGEYPVYTDTVYQTMTDDTLRNKQYVAALQRLVHGRTVIDIGTGRDLNWAVASVHAGARHVDAIEIMPNTFARASEFLARSELSDAIDLHLGSSTDIRLPLPADVCVTETIGSVAGAEGAAATITDARARLIRGDGVVVPDSAVTMAAGASFDAVMGRSKPGFDKAAIPTLHSIFRWNGAPFDVRLRITRPDQTAIVTTGQPIELLDFNGDLLLEQERTVSMNIERPGTIDGILTWMHLQCAPDLPVLSTLVNVTNWGAVFFPLFDKPVPVDKGDTLVLTSRVTLSDDRVHPDYAFEATVRTRAGTYAGQHVSFHHGVRTGTSAIHRSLLYGHS
jgi:protein arginine N-methyltransferase 1